MHIFSIPYDFLNILFSLACVKVGIQYIMGFPGGSDGKEPVCNAEDPGSIPGSGRSSGVENANPLQYSVWENSMDRGACQITVCEAAKSWTQLSD